ncbi:A/G-specific adenine glycosylase [Flavobacterium oreochromis]|uniref:Adenine DNA glycosylase n=1 Tax=Flavobacterium columnare TaxID=996 RepID=A0A246GCJ7_9FLAO|nr:A/G-specific adenine glycosylase [Flavobacterium oreochromis]OWP78832.1 A/G-specific adenine glycosylase [Flavobacterium oreochromis]POR26773.1 A/G-specific adenine glycosylase [Flavobacterium columnare]
MNFSDTIIAWYQQHKRDLPWRKTTDPYLIWLSEIILQQTRVSQGLPYYKAFTKQYPKIQDLAEAEEQDVLKLWQGLGYYSRARNLHSTAKHLTEHNNGIFPNNYKDLQKLKGIGEYTAAAIASFSFNECVPVIDGNVYRVIARYFGLDLDISLPKTKKTFFQLASEVINPNEPAQFNQAIMEFGALQCVPQNPTCTICPLQNSCYALSTNKIGNLPVKTKKTKITNRYFHYLLVIDQNQKALYQQRTTKGIWQNLYELPLIETFKKEKTDEIKNRILESYTNIKSILLLEHEQTNHKLSHQNLDINFWIIKIDHEHETGLAYKELKELPTPIVIHNFLERTVY